MKRISLGDTQAPNVILGLMRIADMTDDDVRGLIGAARDAGIDFFDHAAVYGQRDARLRAPFRRGDAADARRTGGRSPSRPRPASSRTVRTSTSPTSTWSSSAEGSLQGAADRLPGRAAAAPARRAGRAGGGGARVRRARSRRQGAGVRRLEPHPAADRPAADGGAATAGGQPAAAVDHPRADRRAGRRRQHGRSGPVVTLDGGGILDYCRLNGITVQAWSPFQAGFFTGVFLGSPEYPELNAVIDGWPQPTTFRRSPSPPRGSPGTRRTCRSCSAPPTPSGSPALRWGRTSH